MLSGGAFPDPARYLRLPPAAPPPPGSGRRGHQGRPGRIHQYNVWGSPYGTTPGQRVEADFDWPYVESSRLRSILADPVSVLVQGRAQIIQDIDQANDVAKVMLALAILRAFYYIWYIRTGRVSPTFRYKNMADESYMLESVIIARQALQNILNRLVVGGERSLRGLFDIPKLQQLVEGTAPERLYPRHRDRGDPWQYFAMDAMLNNIGNAQYRASYDNLSRHFGEVMRRFYNARFVERPLPNPLADGVNFVPGEAVGRPAFLLDPQATINERDEPIQGYDIPDYAYSRFPVHYVTE